MDAQTSFDPIAEVELTHENVRIQRNTLQLSCRSSFPPSLASASLLDLSAADTLQEFLGTFQVLWSFCSSDSLLGCLMCILHVPRCTLCSSLLAPLGEDSAFWRTFVWLEWPLHPGHLTILPSCLSFSLRYQTFHDFCAASLGVNVIPFNYEVCE